MFLVTLLISLVNYSRQSRVDILRKVPSGPNSAVSPPSLQSSKSHFYGFKNEFGGIDRQVPFGPNPIKPSPTPTPTLVNSKSYFTTFNNGFGGMKHLVQGGPNLEVSPSFSESSKSRLSGPNNEFGGINRGVQPINPPPTSVNSFLNPPAKPVNSKTYLAPQKEKSNT